MERSKLQVKVKHVFFTLVIFSIGTTAFSQSETEDHTKAPKASMIVNIDGQDHYILEGENLQLDSTKKNSILSVKLASYRAFNNSSIAFSYPSDFSFEYQGEPTFKNWNFDGNSFIILYFEMEEKSKIKDFVAGYVAQYGKQNCTVKKPGR